jgi:hypothetical protein
MSAGAAKKLKTEEEPHTEREAALLQDLIIARDALDKMKGVLSQRIRYEQIG